jgi:hypothetical protein
MDARALLGLAQHGLGLSWVTKKSLLVMSLVIFSYYFKEELANELLKSKQKSLFYQLWQTWSQTCR